MNISKSYQDLISCCNYRIMLLDGGFGTVLCQQNLTESDFRGKMFADHYVELKGDNNVLCLTAPDKVKAIHIAYLEAGADLIRTDTFGATSFCQAKYRLQHMAYDIAKAGAQVAREAIKEYNERRGALGTMITPKFVVGSIGPAGDVASVSFAELVEAYGEQIRGLLDGGADVLLVESVFDTLNCKAALYAICKECEKRGELYPIMVSAVIDDGRGRLKSGQSVRAFWHSVSSFPIFSVGFEGPSAADVLPHLRNVKDAYVRVSAFTDGYIPNDLLVNVVGGRGTTPETIRTFMRTLAGRDPRKVPSRNYDLLLSGLDPMEVAPGSGLVDVAAPEKAGKVIRVNQDAGLEDPKSKMPSFLKELLKKPATAERPVMIESVRWDVLLAGMECVQGKGIVNSISLKEGEEVFLARAEEIRRHCMLLANCCFEPQVEEAVAAIRAGEIGEVVHAEGNYYHTLGDRWTPWRLDINRRYRGDLYPTHELGPICQALDIGVSDRLQTLVCMDSAALTGPKEYERVMGDACSTFANGDHTTTLIRTTRGRTILLKHNVLTPQPYERQLTFVGTQGVIRLQDEGSASHAAMTLRMNERLIHSLTHGLPMPISVYDLATWCAVIPLSRQSIEGGFVPVSFD